MTIKFKYEIAPMLVVSSILAAPNGVALPQISASQLMCFATENFVAPVSSQTAALDMQSGALEPREGKTGKILYVLLGLLIATCFGYFLIRSKAAKPDASNPENRG